MIKRKSRLARKEESKSVRQAIFYGCLTLVLASCLLFLGIPALIKMAIFLGNLRTSSMPIEPQDTLPPPPPRFQPLPEATNSARINLRGSAEPGATVKISLTGMAEKETVADNEGAFHLADLSLSPGKNEISAVVTDETGNVSQPSQKLVIVFDQKVPELEILEPVDGAEFFDPQDQVEIKGKTEKEATVLINNHLVIVNQEGDFHYPVKLKEGENQIKVVAIDKAGNQTEAEIKVSHSP